MKPRYTRRAARKLDAVHAYITARRPRVLTTSWTGSRPFLHSSAHTGANYTLSSFAITTTASETVIENTFA